MSSIPQVATLAATVPPHLATATVLLVAATVTLFIGLARRGRSFVSSLPGPVFVWAAAVAFWTRSMEAAAAWTGAAVASAAVALLIHLRLAFRERVDPHEMDLSAARVAPAYLAAVLVVAAAILFYHLGSYSGPLLTWEAPVVAGYPNVGGFAQAFNLQESVLEYTALRFLWDDGLLSAGHTSLFYGAPTYGLFQVLGFSAWTLRAAAVVATLLSVIVIYALARRFFGPVAGAAAAAALGLNSCVLFYGRYGSSPAGTMLAVLLALWCTWLFLERDRPAWWMGSACAAALYAATLQYSPGRIVVLILLGFIPVVLACQWRRLSRQRAAGFAVIAAAAAGVWQLQCAFERQHAFLYARGEQYFDMIANPEDISELFDRDLFGRPVTAETITLADKLELLYRVIQTTLPQYVDLMRPIVETDPLTDVSDLGALPQLYSAPLVVFIVWGVTHSLVRLRSWPHACLLLWMGAGTIPLLLTNRVDAHRSMLFVLPLSLWAGLGMGEAARLMARATVPSGVQHLFAALLGLAVVYGDVHLLHREPHPNAAAADAILNEAAGVPGHVAVGALMDHRELGWVQLAMLERTRRDRNRAGNMLVERPLRAMQDRAGQAEAGARKLRPLLDDATVLLAPADRFRAVAALLQAQGARVAERGPGTFRLLRLDAGAAATGVPDEDVPPLPTIVIPPTPTPIRLATGPQVSLTELKPIAVTFGFAPPKVDRTWAGTLIVMAGVPYAHGLGTHAWCRMTYAVPPGATAFQAVIGFSDEVRECDAAGVTFQVRDHNDAVLFDSGFMDALATPHPVHVDLHGAAAITLVVTEGDNGRDCDHANWAAPAFLLRESTPKSKASAPN